MNHSGNEILESNSLIHFKELVNSVPQFVFVVNTKGVFVFVNNYCETIFGYKAGELVGKPITRIIRQPEKKNIQNIFKVPALQDILKSQNHFLKKDGDEIVIEWSGKRDDEDQLWYCCSHAIEKVNMPSEMQLQFEKKMKEHNKRLSSLLERIGEGFVALDEEGRVIYWNRQAELISGKPREEMLSRKISECYPEMTEPEFCSIYNKAIREQIHQQYEAYYSNEGKWIEIIMHPGNNGLTAFFRDITEQKKIEKELETQKKQVNKKVTAAVIQAQEKERTQISQELHDNVNQVLTTVKLYIELCTNDIGNKELMQRSMKLLQFCIDEIRSLSKQLSAPSLGKISLKDSVKDLVKTMAETGKTKIQLNTKGIQDIEVNKDLHLAIYRILQEHLTNILKHADAKKVRIVINYLDDDIILKVSDDGKGFDMKDTSKGIGIDNMKSRAETLGGRLTINSAPGLGCVLIAHFPGN
jgi:PAS domain S-box-containing protein